jgi:hypothetical protein
VRRESELPGRVAALREFLAERLRQAGSPPARAWIESLPSSLAAAYQLLVDLTR